mmetsp:Transcript_3916/g.9952  ORF Transcript_3916/g.9952 Transcript_3916/m.9952 type:complete len:324 (-) Transcript_3916:5-976(-)
MHIVHHIRPRQDQGLANLHRHVNNHSRHFGTDYGLSLGARHDAEFPDRTPFGQGADDVSRLRRVLLLVSLLLLPLLWKHGLEYLQLPIDDYVYREANLIPVLHNVASLKLCPLCPKGELVPLFHVNEGEKGGLRVPHQRVCSVHERCPALNHRIDGRSDGSILWIAEDCVQVAVGYLPDGGGCEGDGRCEPIPLVNETGFFETVSVLQHHSFQRQLLAVLGRFNRAVESNEAVNHDEHGVTLVPLGEELLVLLDPPDLDVLAHILELVIREMLEHLALPRKDYIQNRSVHTLCHSTNSSHDIGALLYNKLAVSLRRNTKLARP